MSNESNDPEKQPRHDNLPDESKRAFRKAEKETREKLLRPVGKQLGECRQNTSRGKVGIGQGVWKARQIGGPSKGRNGWITSWLARQGISRSYAYKCEAIFEQFCPDGQMVSEIDNFDPSALDVFAPKKTPPKAMQEALRLARNGDLITRDRAEAILREFTVQPETSEAMPTVARTVRAAATELTVHVVSVVGVGRIVICKSKEADEAKLSQVKRAIENLMIDWQDTAA